MKTPLKPVAVPAQLLAGFSNLDIGSPQLAGSVRQVDTGWDLIAGGADIWEKSDQFHFVYRQVTGDFDIAVRVESFVSAHPSRKFRRLPSVSTSAARDGCLVAGIERLTRHRPGQAK